MGNSHKKPSCLEPVAQLKPNFDGIVIGWSSSKIVSGSCTLPPRWPPQCSCVVIESSFDPGEQLQAPGSLWSLGTMLSSTNKTDCYNTTEILLKVALNTIKQPTIWELISDAHTV
jgi:hypothetical protein